MPKTIAIGDIHGCFDAMMSLVEWVDPHADHRLIFLGDYVNRGPDSEKVIDWLATHSELRDLICLRGNHEIMWLESQVDAVRRRRIDDDISYGWDDLDDGSEFWTQDANRFVRDLRRYFETEKHIFVHASVYGEMSMEDQPDYMLFWEGFDSMTRPESGKKVVCGHTSQKSGVPLENEFAVCIDTNCCRGGWLTGLDVDSGEYFQTNQDGSRNQDWLENWI